MVAMELEGINVCINCRDATNCVFYKQYKKVSFSSYVVVVGHDDGSAGLVGMSINFTYAIGLCCN